MRTIKKYPECLNLHPKLSKKSFSLQLDQRPRDDRPGSVFRLFLCFQRCGFRHFEARVFHARLGFQRVLNPPLLTNGRWCVVVADRNLFHALLRSIRQSSLLTFDRDGFSKYRPEAMGFAIKYAPQKCLAFGAHIDFRSSCFYAVAEALAVGYKSPPEPWSAREMKIERCRNP